MRLFRTTQPGDQTVTFDMEGRSDHAEIDDEYLYWDFDGNNFWRVEAGELPHNGNDSSSVLAVGGGVSRHAVYSIPSQAQSRKATLSAYMANRVLTYDPGFANFHKFELQDSDGTRIAHFQFKVFRNVPNTYLVRIVSRWPDGGTDETDLDLTLPVETYWGLRMVLDMDAKTVSFYHDVDDDGNWALVNTGTWTSDISGNIDKLLVEVHPRDNERGYANFYIDDLILEPGPITAEEITGVEVSECSKRFQGQGAVSALIDDYENANFSDFEDMGWTDIEVWSNDLTFKCGEYTLIEPNILRNQVRLSGPEMLRTLDRMGARVNTIEAAGEVTAVGAATIDDSNASFSGLTNKICLFADAVGPSVETAYPAAGSNHYKTSDDNPATPFGEGNTFADLSTQGTRWIFTYKSTANNDTFYIQLEIATTNGGSATAFEVTLQSKIYGPSAGDESEVWIYDFTNVTWRSLGNWTSLALAGWLSPVIEFHFTEADIPVGVIADYFSGDPSPEFHIKVSSGETTTVSEFLKMEFDIAELKVTHTTTYVAATTNYTIDALTPTQLTFTDQTPLADGVAIGDRYKVGDFIHNVMTSAFQNAYLAGLTLLVDTTTQADAQDFRTSYIGDIIKRYERILKRESFQAKGFIVKLLDPSNYESTGLSLTHADFVNNPGEEWVYNPSARDVIRHAQVLGDGVFAEGFQTPVLPSPQSLIISDTRVSSQVTANDIIANILSQNQDKRKFLWFTLDLYDGTDYTELDIGKTINVNIYSGLLNITGGLIREMFFKDQPNGHLFCRMLVEDI